MHKSRSHIFKILEFCHSDDGFGVFPLGLPPRGPILAPISPRKLGTQRKLELVPFGSLLCTGSIGQKSCMYYQLFDLRFDLAHTFYD